MYGYTYIGLEGIYASNPGEAMEIPLYKDVMEAIHEVKLNAVAVSEVCVVIIGLDHRIYFNLALY
jgi:hypothetical protein